MIAILNGHIAVTSIRTFPSAESQSRVVRALAGPARADCSVPDFRRGRRRQTRLLGAIVCGNAAATAVLAGALSAADICHIISLAGSGSLVAGGSGQLRQRLVPDLWTAEIAGLQAMPGK
jgi:hypothetical protein